MDGYLNDVASWSVALRDLCVSFAVFEDRDFAESEFRFWTKVVTFLVPNTLECEDAADEVARGCLVRIPVIIEEGWDWT